MKKLFLLVSLFLILTFTACANSEAVSSRSYETNKNNENRTSVTQSPVTPSVQPVLGTVSDANALNEDTTKQDSVNEQINITKDIKQYNGHFYSGKAVVLTYHHISDKPFSGITIKPKRFESDLKSLKDNGFNVISLKKLINCMQGNDTLPLNAVVITFDDGIESFYKYAYPLLKKYNMPATNFIITSRTEAYKPSTQDYNPLSPAEIQEMYNSGLIDIGSHTHNSHDYVTINEKLKQGGRLAYKIYDPVTKTYESEEAYTKRVTEDLNTSREIIKKYIGVEPEMLCFPFGHYNKNLLNIAKQCGFKYFITTLIGPDKQNSHSSLVFRIRAGDSCLTSEKLIQNIVDCGNNISRPKPQKPVKKADSSTQPKSSDDSINVPANTSIDEKTEDIKKQQTEDTTKQQSEETTKAESEEVKVN